MFTIGLASYIALLEGLFFKTNNPAWERLAKFWTQVFAVVFGMGVVSGIVMSFQFGTNWSNFSYATANFLGPILSYEVITAFFLEAGFLGVMLFGRNKVPKGVHLFAACMVALGTFISAFWILSANSLMQTPTGLELRGEIYHVVSWSEAIFNASFFYRFWHMVVASFLTGGFVVAGVSAWFLLKGREVEANKKALSMSGVAFEFRFKANKSRFLWSWAFAGGSFIAAFAQGAVVGTYIQGFETENFRYVGGALDWLTPFTVLTGVGLVAGYALLGSTWLILKSEGYIQDWAYKITPRLLLAVLVIFGIIGVWSPMIDDFLKERWFSGVSLLWVLPLITLFFAGWIYRAVKKRQEGFPFVATLGLFISTFVALIFSKWPYVVPPNYTFWDAASAHESQLFLLLGLLFVVPFILMYSAWSYWVFRGKVKAGDGYH